MDWCSSRARTLVFSLPTRTWVDFPLYQTDGGMMASRDGSRALIGQSGSAYSYIDASTNAIVVSPNSQPFYCCGVVLAARISGPDQ